MTGRVIGIIGGSGLYRIDGLADVEWRRVKSPFGDPSDEFCFGTLGGQPVVFLPRHGRGHVLPPSAIPFRANIDALKRCGVTDIISLSAVGSLRENLTPGDFVLVDQFIDRTFARDKSFFGPGCVAHVSMARPVCRRIGDAVAEAGRARALVKAAVPVLARQVGSCPQGCDHALENALITAPDHRYPALLARLDAVAGRVLKR